MKDKYKTEEQLIQELAELHQRVAKLKAADTERKRAEEALRASAQQWRTTFDAINDAVCLLDMEGRILRCNEAMTKLLGKPFNEIIGRTCDELSHPRLDSVEGSLLTRLRETRHREEVDLPIGEQWFHAVMDPLLDEAGDLIGAVHTISDITKRKRAEEALQESEEKYRSLVENSIDGIAIVQGPEIRFVNQALLEIFGYQSEDEIVGHTFTDFISPEFRNLMAERARAREKREDTPSHYEFKALRKDGTEFDAEIAVSTIGYEGSIARQGIIRDITERKRAEEELRESEETARALLNAPTDVAALIDTRGIILDANEAMAERFSRPVDELVGMYGWDLVPPGLAEPRKAYVDQVIRSGEPRRFEDENKGTWFDNVFYPVFDAQGKVTKVALLARDITERKRAEKALRQERDRAQKYLAIAGVMIVAINSKGEVTLINKKGCEVLGYKKEEEIIGQNWFESFLPGRIRNEVKAVFAKLTAGEIEAVEYFENPVLTKSGVERIIAWHNTVLTDEAGNVLGTLSSGADITEHKRAERLLRALNGAALAMEQALTHEEMFAAVAGEFKKLGFSCIVFPMDEKQSRLFPKYLSYESRALRAAEKLVGIRHEAFSIPVENVDVYRKVVWERKTIFLENAEVAISQVLPEPANRLAGLIAKTLKVPKSIPAPLIVDDEVIGVLSVQSDDLTEEDIPVITAFAHQMAAAWRKARLLQDLERSLTERRRAHEELQRSFQELRRTFEGTINVLVSTTEMRDPYTAGHQRRVTQLAWTIAKEMGLPEEQIEGIRMAGLIHDLGKISVPAEILNKPGLLTELEYGLIKMHPQTGHDVLKSIDFPWPVAQIVLQHHERMDGSGYPQGLSREEIILEARILGVADVVEAMASHRPYRSARGIDEALQEISQNRGTLYDPEVVDVCLKLFTEKSFTFE
jgi:PAS domain S-box-containing protein